MARRFCLDETANRRIIDGETVTFVVRSPVTSIAERRVTFSIRKRAIRIVTNRDSNEIFIVGVDYQNTEGGLVAFRPRPPVRTLARFLVFHADTVAFANRRARGHVFHARTVTVISTRLETLVTHALVRSHALPVFAPVLARWRTAEFFRPDETFPTLANIRRYAGAVVTRHADGFAPIVRVLLEPVVASANIGLRARAVRAILIANRFTARDDRVHDHFVLLRGHIDHPISLDAVASVGRCAMAARLARKLADWLAHVAHRVVSCRSVAVVTRAHVGRRTRPVHASFLAHRFAHVPGVIR